MDLFLFLEWLHVIGAAILFGTGLGIAFFMFMADRNGDVALIAGVTRIVVIADFLFTASAVILQPVTGFGMMMIANYNLWDSWIALSLALYVLTGIFWLPVVWMQMEMSRLAQTALRDQTALPTRYHLLMRRWFWAGWPAFASVLGILFLMVVKPELW